MSERPYVVRRSYGVAVIQIAAICVVSGAWCYPPAHERGVHTPMSATYWIRWLHLLRGHLAISLVRNDLRAYGLGGRTFTFERESGLGWFITLHAGVYWLNVDWV